MSDAGSDRTRVGVDIGGTFTDLVARGGVGMFIGHVCVSFTGQQSTRA